MNLEQYVFNADQEHKLFKFESIGPKGVIKKAVRYDPIPFLSTLDGKPAINIAFGDWNEEDGSIDDTTVSNNCDKDKILATIASTVVAYFKKNGGLLPVHAIGRTPAKTRLYQMGISGHLPEIERLFLVYGYKEKKWMPFRSGVNYEAFLGIEK